MSVIKLDRKDEVLPLVAIREGVVFPSTETLLTFGRPKSVAAVEAVYKSGQLMAFFSQKNHKDTDPGQDGLYRIGSLGKVERILPMEKGIYGWVKGVSRVKLDKIEATKPFLVGKVTRIPEIIEEGDSVKALAKHVIEKFQKSVNLGKAVDVMMMMRLMGESSPSEVADQVAYVLELKTSEKQKLLETLSVEKRLEKVAEYITHEIGILKIERKIDSRTQKKFDRSMREAVLRERKKTIEEELGEEESSEIKELHEKIVKAKLSKEAAKKAKKELKRLAHLNPNHPEYGYIRTYLDWLTEIPWSVSTPNKTSISQAAKTLNKDHHGLKKAKERVVEYLAVMKLKERAKKAKVLKSRKRKIPKEVGGPTILCFIGPPGVGKTSIGRSIARALGRKFVRMSVGGIRDEAEIRGHRRTYVGAMPGRIIQGIKNSGSNNPVFMLDEIDKVGSDFRGDPSAALLEALDPEQNYEFSDHYLEVPFNLSKVMFITTGNILDTIPPALRDRMEIIRFPGYTGDEKFMIAKNFLWNKQLRANGLVDKSVKLVNPAIHHIIRRYTREAGVRELERNLATVCRKLARKKAEKKKMKKTVNRVDVAEFLGPAKFTETLAEKIDEVGISTGLAYTQSGGDILFIEVALMPGKGKLLLTGKLGEVMKESGAAALSYVRSRWQELGLAQDFYKKLDVHVHVPEGAVPKDGPSAGVAMATALVSALTEVPTRREVGMTGEITLRGRVLEIGGVKEKVIAGHRAGLKTIILPKNNKKDLEDVPGKVKKDIKFVFVEHMDEVLGLALKKKLKAKKAK
ncbi:endopeptidase La [Patescibacteria group bacterium]